MQFLKRNWEWEHGLFWTLANSLTCLEAATKNSRPLTSASLIYEAKCKSRRSLKSPFLAVSITGGQDFRLHRDLQIASQISGTEVRGPEFLFAAFKHSRATAKLQKCPRISPKPKLESAFFDFIYWAQYLGMTLDLHITVCCCSSEWKSKITWKCVHSRSKCGSHFRIFIT